MTGFIRGAVLAMAALSTMRDIGLAPATTNNRPQTHKELRDADPFGQLARAVPPRRKLSAADRLTIEAAEAKRARKNAKRRAIAAVA